MNFLTRWKYRFLHWFYDQPNSLNRRVSVENALMRHYFAKTSPTPDECLAMAQKLGISKGI